ALGDELRDLTLLRGQLVERARVALARGLPGRPQLGHSALLPGGRAELREEVDRDPQMGARVRALAGAPEVLAVAQLEPGAIERQRDRGVCRNRALVPAWLLDLDPGEHRAGPLGVGRLGPVAQRVGGGLAPGLCE